MRYSNRVPKINSSPIYREQFINRGVRFIEQYRTAELAYPSPEQQALIATRVHTWKMGDSFQKLAHEAYDDSRLWWVIAWYNKAPTEFHLNVGNVIEIPVDLDQILEVYNI
tara:strand:- start:222 stop:554 length:333 start_codon:yes stop_codon:yes gene_type:complete